MELGTHRPHEEGEGAFLIKPGMASSKAYCGPPSPGSLHMLPRFSSTPTLEF